MHNTEETFNRTRACGVMGSTSALLACHQMLECEFESRFELEFLGFSMWHFLKLIVRGVSPGTPVSTPPSLINGFSQ